MSGVGATEARIDGGRTTTELRGLHAGAGVTELQILCQKTVTEPTSLRGSDLGRPYLRSRNRTYVPLPGGGEAMPDSQPVARAIKLAERILSEVTRPQQDWGVVRSLAISLASLADRASREPRDPGEPGGEQRVPASRRP